MFLLLLALPSLCSVQEVCYPTVVRHRIDSLFPTNRLLCIAKQNDNIEYSNVQILQSVEDWQQYSLSREVATPTPNQNTTLVLLENSTEAFKIPATISDGEACSGTRSIEWNRNSTTICRLKITSLANCTSEKFLNSRLLFGNVNLSGKIAFDASLFDPISNVTGCYGVMKMVTLNFVKNATSILRAHVDIVYDSLTRQNFGEFEQTFNVVFVENVTNTSTGYSVGDPVYGVNGMIAIPLSIPILGACFSSQQNLSPIIYSQTLSGLCTLDKTATCDEAKLLARRFYSQVFPAEILSAPTDVAQPALVNRINVTWDEVSPSQSTCRLPVSSLFQIYTSRQGTVNNYRQIIIGASFQLSLNYIDYLPGQTVFLPLSVRFTDVTPKPKSIFASLPYIDIRLPNDFFYPFIRNSENDKNLKKSLITFILLFIYLSVN